MAFVGSGLFVAVLLVVKSTFALECYECTAKSAGGCSLSTKQSCSGSCFYALSKGVNDISLSSYIRGCIALGNAQMEGCADTELSFSGTVMNQRQCYCLEDLCNYKVLTTVNAVVNKTIQCYECSGGGCGSPSVVSCNGACATVQYNQGGVAKSCVSNADLFGTGGSIAMNMKFTGCVATTYGGSRSVVHTCHENLCNGDTSQLSCKFTTGASNVQRVSALTFILTIVNMLAM